MRGSPLLQCLVGAVAFALFAIPMVRLTLARPAVIPAADSGPGSTDAATARHTWVRIRFSHPPNRLSLKIGDRDLVGKLPAPVSSPIELETAIPFSKENLELALSAGWPEGTPETAVTVEIEPDELDIRRETHWSPGSVLNATLVFQW